MGPRALVGNIWAIALSTSAFENGARSLAFMLESTFGLITHNVATIASLEGVEAVNKS